MAINNKQLSHTVPLQESNRAAIAIHELVPKLLPSVVIVNSRKGDDVTTTQLGTGFFISPNLVVTAFHVLRDRDKIEISRYRLDRDYESTHYNLEYDEVEILGYDPLIDIAVLHIVDEKIIGVPAPWGKTMVGDTIISIGHPYGYEFSVTKGIVSYIGRRNDTYEFNRYVQTDTPINSGNSGGPLFNDSGEVVGVVQAVVGTSGIAMAIEAPLVEKTVQRILECQCEVKHASFGIGLKMVGAGQAQVTKLLKDSAAYKSGILVGDIVVGIDSVQYYDILSMTDYVQTKKPGDIISVSIIRNNKLIEI